MGSKIDIRIVTLTAASGSGKTTLVNQLYRVIGAHTARLLPSYTTREPREEDIEGEYICISRNVFDKIDGRGEFIWMAHPHGNSYGTTFTSLDIALDSDKLWFMSVVPNVMPNLIEYARDAVIPFYISPPKEDILRARLEKRGDSDDDIEKRLKDCKQWEKDAKESTVDYTYITNNGTIQEAALQVLVGLVNSAYFD